jgi:hypothetical protein
MSKFTDSSEPLFMMYRKLIEYDTNLIQGKLKGVDNVVIFVRTSFLFSIRLTHQVNITDGLVLCSRCHITYRDSPGPQTRRTGYIRILPHEYLSASSSLRFQHIPPFHPGSTSSVLCPEIRNLGERTLVHEFMSQYFRCTYSSVDTGTCTSLPLVSRVCPAQPPPPSADIWNSCHRIL